MADIEKCCRTCNHFKKNRCMHPDNRQHHPIETIIDTLEDAFEEELAESLRDSTPFKHTGMMLSSVSARLLGFLTEELSSKTSNADFKIKEPSEFYCSLYF